MIYLFLDDERNPEHVTWVPLPKASWNVVRTFHEFKTFVLDHGCPDFISFDNDLGQPLEGIDCARWLVAHCLYDAGRFPDHFDYQVHSMNSVAKDRIIGLLDQALKIKDEFNG